MENSTKLTARWRMCATQIWVIIILDHGFSIILCQAFTYATARAPTPYTIAFIEILLEL